MKIFQDLKKKCIASQPSKNTGTEKDQHDVSNKGIAIGDATWFSIKRLRATYTLLLLGTFTHTYRLLPNINMSLEFIIFPHKSHYSKSISGVAQKVPCLSDRLRG